MLFGRQLSVAIGLLLLATTARGEPGVSLPSLLEEMIDVEAVARWPEPAYTCRQASSYDRHRAGPDKPGWFDNNDNSQFVRTEVIEGRKRYVMFDADGPGAIVRFWLTTDAKKTGFLRVYIDGAADAAIEYPAYDLLAGPTQPGAPLATAHPGYTPKGNGGNTLYLPIPYAKHCTVTWEEAAGDHITGPRYYQINYRTYAAGTPVKSFSAEAYNESRELIRRVNRVLEHPPAHSGGRTATFNRAIEPKVTAALELPAGPAAVRELALKLKVDDPAHLEQALRSVIVRATFDDEETIWCPVGDFFGSGVGLNEMRSWYRSVDREGGQLTCRWVMPYARAARVVLEILGTEKVHVQLDATTTAWAWDARSMHFRSNWHRQAGIKTKPYSDWNFISASGKGVYVGDTLCIFNPLKSWYGEGDEKIWVDGESFPSHIGTGTEDYYNFSWAPKPLFQTPFANEVRMDEPMTQGHNTVTRTRNLDGIPFTKSLKFDMEIMPWKEAPLDYAATTYWYALPGATSNREPQPAEAARALPQLPPVLHIAGAIECEELKVTAKSEGVVVIGPQDMSPFGTEFGDALPHGWSGGSHLLAKGSGAGQFIEVAVPATDDAPRKVTLFATKAADYGMLRFTVNGKASTATFDGYATRVEPSGPIELGTFAPVDRQFVLRAEITGTNAASVGAKFLVGLDCVVLAARP
jgi:hypothetical protein